MGAGSMIPGDADGSWRLVPAHAATTQGLVVSPFAHLPEACALFLQLPANAGGAWLQMLRAVCPITAATGAATPAAALAFTWTGLQAMGLDAGSLGTFSAPFREGMHQIDRQRRLSDNEKSGTIIDGGAQWSGNTPAPVFVLPLGADPPPAPASETPITVHAVLLLYAADAAALAARVPDVESALAKFGVTVSLQFALSLRFDADGCAREHFGFADGISQPVPQGDAIVSASGAPLAADDLHGIAAGDLLMGHCNAQGEPAPGPMVSRLLDPGGLLAADGAPEGFRNLGLDGSYLVMRELRQDVAAFWHSMHTAMGPAATDDDAQWLATRVVGRTMDGDMLIPGATVTGGTVPRAGGMPANDFRFYATDPHGLGCPIGSHVRRANPRDGLAATADAAPDLLAASRNHRILRRGRKFGPTIANALHDDGASRGLLFMCLNTDLVRQFEFVQQTWMLNSNFATLLDETDPLLGPHGRFTVPAQPLRKRPTVDTFVRFAGGEYFFLPSLPALDYLQTLPVAAAVPVA